MGRVVNAMAQLLCTWETGKELVSTVQDSGWALGLVSPGMENLTPTWFKPWTVQPIVSRYTDYVVSTANRNNTEH